MSKAKHRHCPFCGGQKLKPTQLSSQPDVAVICQNKDCEAVGPCTDSETEAWRLWDQRAGDLNVDVDSADLSSFEIALTVPQPEGQSVDVLRQVVQARDWHHAYSMAEVEAEKRSHHVNISVNRV